MELVVKEPICQCRKHKILGFSLWVGKIPLRRTRKPTPIYLSGEYHAQKSLAANSPQSCKESDMTEATYMYTCIKSGTKFLYSPSIKRLLLGIDFSLIPKSKSAMDFFEGVYLYVISTALYACQRTFICYLIYAIFQLVTVL